MTTMPTTNFRRVLLNIGATDRERLKKLKVSRRTLIKYKNGQLPRVIHDFMRQPQLLRALADDAEFQSPQSGHDGFPTTEHSRGEDGWRADSPPEVCP